MLVCDIYNKFEQRYVFEWEKDLDEVHVRAHVYVVHCSNTVINVALGLWLFGHPCYITFSPWIRVIGFDFLRG